MKDAPPATAPSGQSSSPVGTWIKAACCLFPTLLCQDFAHIVLLPRIHTYYQNQKAELPKGEHVYVFVALAHNLIGSEWTMLMCVLAAIPP